MEENRRLNKFMQTAAKSEKETDRTNNVISKTTYDQYQYAVVS